MSVYVYVYVYACMRVCAYVCVCVYVCVGGRQLGISNRGLYCWLLQWGPALRRFFAAITATGVNLGLVLDLSCVGGDVRVRVRVRIRVRVG